MDLVCPYCDSPLSPLNGHGEYLNSYGLNEREKTLLKRIGNLHYTCKHCGENRSNPCFFLILEGQWFEWVLIDKKDLNHRTWKAMKEVVIFI